MNFALGEAKDAENLRLEGTFYGHPRGRSKRRVGSLPLTNRSSLEESYLPAVPFARGSFHGSTINAPIPPRQAVFLRPDDFLAGCSIHLVDSFPEPRSPHRVRAPSAADPTWAAYFARTPAV